MKKIFDLSLALILTLSIAASIALSQTDSNQERSGATVLLDAVLEKDSLHNLKVARHYFKQKKAYRAAIARCEEIIAGNPTFSRLDEVLYIAGTSSLRLSENRGKQAPNLPVEQLREDAREYLSRLVNDFPQSDYREKAQEELRSLGGVKAKEGEKTSANQ